jgi:putative ABC transport system substrate-binding protein
VIGFLSSSALDSYRRDVDAFHRGLEEVGFVEGRNVVIEYRVAGDQNDRLPALALDLADRRVSVIATFSNAAAALAAKAATQSIPIVFVMGADPVGTKLVTSLARPDANVTGVTLLSGQLALKRLTLLRELVPTATRIGTLVNYSNPSYSKEFMTNFVARARDLGIELLQVNASTPGEIDDAFARFIQQHIGAMAVGPDAFFWAQRARIVALAARFNIPAIYFVREFVEIGGLISYSSHHPESFRQAGIYVGRILKGDKPADLPVLQPTRFELAINLKTAKALGLTVPRSILILADEVIE